MTCCKLHFFYQLLFVISELLPNTVCVALWPMVLMKLLVKMLPSHTITVYRQCTEVKHLEPRWRTVSKLLLCSPMTPPATAPHYHPLPRRPRCLSSGELEPRGDGSRSLVARRSQRSQQGTVPPFTPRPSSLPPSIHHENAAKWSAALRL